jgi:hypothetical protein
MKGNWTVFLVGLLVGWLVLPAATGFLASRMGKK